MEIHIELEDVEEGNYASLHNSEDSTKVIITLRKGDDEMSSVVSIEEFKLALRKICVK